MERHYAPVVEQAGDDIAARAQALAGALSGDGFVASSRQRQEPLRPLSAEQLCQGHCPIQQLAAEFPLFCDAETEVFSRLVGVDVRRLSTLASGGHVCTTHIPTGRSAPTGSAASGWTSTPAEAQATMEPKYPTISKKGRDDGSTSTGCRHSRRRC